MENSMFSAEKKIDGLYDALLGDIETLFELMVRRNSPLSQSNVRAASAILRKWINEHKLGYLANKLNVKCEIPVLDTSKVFDAIERRDDIAFFSAMGVRFDGRAMMGAYHATTPSVGAPIIPVDMMNGIDLKINQFAEQRRIYYEGRAISCRDIISFVANKMGGVHIDMTRNPDDLFLERAAHFMMFGGPRIDPPDGCEVYMALERTGSEILSAFHVEIAAAAGSFMQMKFDGRPLMRLYVDDGVFKRIMKFFGFHEKPKFIVVDC